MIQKTILCLLFILTNSVIANASPLYANPGIARIETSNWISTHAGKMQLDGMPVVAAVEALDSQINLPNVLANQLQTLVPLVPVDKKAFRLTIVAAENPSLRAQFVLVPKTVSVDGTLRFGYVSEANEAQDLQFLLLTEEDGSLKGVYSRKSSTNEFDQGEFILAPLHTILHK